MAAVDVVCVCVFVTAHEWQQSRSDSWPWPIPFDVIDVIEATVRRLACMIWHPSRCSGDLDIGTGPTQH